MFGVFYWLCLVVDAVALVVGLISVLMCFVIVIVEFLSLSF